MFDDHDLSIFVSSLIRIHLISSFFTLGIPMELDQRQLQAAHQLGEAILRFVKAVESPKQVDFRPVSTVQPTESPADKIENRLLRVGEVAEMLSLGRSMIYELMNSGRLPSVKIGNARRIKLNEALKLLDGVD